MIRKFIVSPIAKRIALLLLVLVLFSTVQVVAADEVDTYTPPIVLVEFTVQLDTDGIGLESSDLGDVQQLPLDDDNDNDNDNDRFIRIRKWKKPKPNNPLWRGYPWSD